MALGLANLSVVRALGTNIRCGWLLLSKAFLIGLVHLPEAVMCPACLRAALDIFDDLLAKAIRCLSHRPLLSGY